MAEEYYSKVFDPRKIDDVTNNYLWTSESVELAIDGLSHGYKLKQNPFLPNVKDVRLRRANLPFKYSDDEMFILSNTLNDKIWFCDNFGVLKDGSEGWKHIKLRDYQKNLLRRYEKNRHNIILFPRQSGKTTTTVLEIVHYIITNIDKDIVVIAQTDTVVSEIFTKVKNAIGGLPFFLQPGIVTYREGDMMTFDNGCRFKCGIASEATVQGFALDFLYIDEFAYIRPNLANKFWGNIFPTLSNNPNSKCIITSTPNGRNLFHTLWTNAVAKKNTFVPYKIYWYDVPGRDEEFKRMTISNIGEEYWEMGYELSFDTQLKTIFNTKTQKNLRVLQESMQEDWSMDNHPLGNLFGMYFINPEKVPYDLSNDWFLLGVDIGEGLDQDDSVLKLKKITYDSVNKRLKYTSVGIFHDNNISVEEFAVFVMDFIKYLNISKIKLVVENNNYGGEFFNQIKNTLLLQPIKYQYFDNTIIALFERDSKKAFEKGIRWNEYNKKAAVKYMANMISSGEMEETHYLSIEQYLNFGKRPNDTYAAQYGHDDLVMADVTISYFIRCNNMFSSAFLKECEYQLRTALGIETEEERIKREEKEKKNDVYMQKGYVLRDHEAEIEKREGKEKGCFLI